MSVKRIGVLTSGGDAPGMNPCVRAVVRTALYHGVECYGIRRGWNGLITGDIVKLDEKSVSHTINRGGTILYTARSKEFMTEEGQRKAVSTCKFLGLDSIIAIGGDGTFRGARALSKYGINVIGIPGTIDNDISCTHYCWSTTQPPLLLKLSASTKRSAALTVPKLNNSNNVINAFMINIFTLV